MERMKYPSGWLSRYWAFLRAASAAMMMVSSVMDHYSFQIVSDGQRLWLSVLCRAGLLELQPQERLGNVGQLIHYNVSAEESRQPGLWPQLSTDEDIHGLLDLAVDANVGAEQAEVTDLM